VLALAAGLIAVNHKMSSATFPDAERLPRLVMPRPGEKVVFFGDSWTQGYSASPETSGYAYRVGQRLGVVAEVKSGRGSGYVNLGADNAGTYKDRLLPLPVDPDVRLLILQGSVNDLRYWKQARPAAVEAMTLAREKFPSAQIVVLAPAPAKAEDIDAVRTLSEQITSAASSLGLYVINPAARGWIDGSNIDTIIDPVTRHPSTQGHAFLADKLLEALQELARDGQPRRHFDGYPGAATS